MANQERFKARRRSIVLSVFKTRGDDSMLYDHDEFKVAVVLPCRSDRLVSVSSILRDMRCEICVDKA
jgi:hypothetical protein